MSRHRPTGRWVGRFLDPTDRRILSLAVPALGALAVEPLYVLVDTAIVGRIGTAQLAGLALAATVLSFVVVGSNFLAYGTTERVARRVGAGDQPGAADVGVQALWLSVLIGMPAAILLAVAARPICRLLGGSGDVLRHAGDYLQISAVGIPFVLVTLAAQGVLRGVSAYRLPLVILFVSNLVNTALEIVFVFGLDLGIPGSAWSTVIAQALAAVGFAVAIRSHLLPAATRRPTRAGIAPLANAGRHLMLRVGAMLAVFGGSTAIAARIDEPTLAAHQIVVSFFTFLALSLDALAVPAQTLVAEDLGRGSVATARQLASRAVRLSLAAATAVAVVVAASAPWLPHAFTGDGAVASRTTAALWFLAVMMFPAAIAFAHDGVLIGAGDYRFLGRAAVGYLVAVVPLGVLVLVFRDLGIAGIWAAFTVWMVLRAAANHHRTNRVLGV
ncbi:MAG TPA: MATE family efflux transporter [Ilumatobacteraceae bacterium]|nr:MATE family efflux transporter [Ilumatobacteraceae bacterium]